MKTIDDLLRNKTRGTDVHCVSPDAFIIDALRAMAEHNIGALLVLENEKLVGVISERDYARRVILEGKSSLDTPVSEIMSREVPCLTPEHTIEDGMALMTKKCIRHLAVLKNEQIVGVLSIGDLVKGVISEKDFMLEQLETYITGRSHVRKAAALRNFSVVPGVENAAAVANK